ncbi:MAG: hypothetical protein EBR28_12135 [Planctomycetia bacterium]|nr:hypothetical protein [Planctomycetia bacterium]
MRPAPVGTRIRVIRNRNNHTYTLGRVYCVQHDDHDGTFKAADSAGNVGNWLRWDEVEPAGPSTWARIAADLPEELVRFLSAFDGIDDIVLKESVLDGVLADLPDTHEQVTTFAGTDLGKQIVAANNPLDDSRKEQKKS